MNARTALINFHNHMVKLYGENYRDVWTEDDRETAEILERRASADVTAQTAVRPPDTLFLRRFKGHRIEAAKVTPKERTEAWQAITKTANPDNRVRGKLSKASGLYDGAQPKRKKIKKTVTTEPITPKISPDDIDSQNIFAYLMGK